MSSMSYGKNILSSVICRVFLIASFILFNILGHIFSFKLVKVKDDIS